MKLGLKVDVDTFEGMREGVPRLLQLFKELGIKVSFYIPFGPDESGKAIFRVFKKKGFLKKMLRTNPLSLYGPKTMLRGTLLPAPKIGASFPDIVLKVLEDGHELGIHGYNHVLWQDHLLEMKEAEVRAEYDSGIAAYEKVVGVKPKAFAAPAWFVSPSSLKLIDQMGFDYASDTRGQKPFMPTMLGMRFKTPQIPSTLPTADELLGLPGMDPNGMFNYLTGLMRNSPLERHVHTIHTEVEAKPLFENFSQWLRNLQRDDCEFFRLADWAKTFSNLPENEVFLGELPGRAGPVACQKV